MLDGPLVVGVGQFVQRPAKVSDFAAIVPTAAVQQQDGRRRLQGKIGVGGASGDDGHSLSDDAVAQAAGADGIVAGRQGKGVLAGSDLDGGIQDGDGGGDGIAGGHVGDSAAQRAGGIGSQGKIHHGRRAGRHRHPPGRGRFVAKGGSGHVVDGGGQRQEVNPIVAGGGRPSATSAVGRGDDGRPGHRRAIPGTGDGSGDKAGMGDGGDGGESVHPAPATVVVWQRDGDGDGGAGDDVGGAGDTQRGTGRAHEGDDAGDVGGGHRGAVLLAVGAAGQGGAHVHPGRDDVGADLTPRRRATAGKVRHLVVRIGRAGGEGFGQGGR